MRIKGLVDEDFVNFKLPSMFIASPYCTFKCEKESGVSCCQNGEIANQPTIDIDTDTLIKRYLSNPISRVIVFGGLEPFETSLDLIEFISKLRHVYHCDDTIVIYTGFDKDEIEYELVPLRALRPIIIKYGRVIPDQPHHKDELLGVELASDSENIVV